jgi:4-carboxymuconolactone decarboxylase
MYMPEIFKSFTETYPELAEAIEQVGKLSSQAGPLDEKTKHLVQMGIGLGVGSKGGVRSHARQALEAGASREEILHALLSGTSTVGFPAMIAAYGWARAALDDGDSSK